MASILNEYVARRMGLLDLQNELQSLIKKYNEYTGRYMFVYASDINKGRNPNVDVSLVQDDFYNIQDILRENTEKQLDFYIETPGGSGEASEEIARFLRNKFETVNFVIAGEAKSAGTILALSGDNIYMTETGSLGPIDAQVRIGRYAGSAHDYKEWVDKTRKEAEEKGKLNPFDAIMVAQISPIELSGIINSLEFAKDLVKGWLEKYKFKNWTKTRSTGKEVTAEMRKNRAGEVADMLCDHTAHRTHGRSLKIPDLQEVLLIERLDDNPTLADVVYRIKTILRLIFDSSTVYKIFYTSDTRLSKNYVISSNNNIPSVPSAPSPQQAKNAIPKNAEFVDIELNCPKCHKKHNVRGYLDITSDDIKNKKLMFNQNVNDNDILVCDNIGCNFALDLKPIKNQIEGQAKRKITFK